MDNNFEFLLEILACPICKSGVTLIGDKLRCSLCSASYMIRGGIPIMLPPKSDSELEVTINQWSNIYNKINSDNIMSNLNEYNSTYLKDNLKYIERFWNINKGDIYFEVGCGPAFQGLEMQRRGCKVVGLDISFPAVKIAKQMYDNLGVSGSFVCGDMLRMPFKEKVFDYIYGGGAIEHFKETEAAIKELYMTSKKNALVFNTVPCVSLSVIYRQFYGNIPDLPILRQFFEFIHLKILKGKYLTFGYEKSFTQEKLRRMFKRVGFKNIDIGLFDTYLPINLIRNERIKHLFRKLARFRLFYPMVYINAKK